MAKLEPAQRLASTSGLSNFLSNIGHCFVIFSAITLANPFLEYQQDAISS